jgi:hypothetical protein
MADTPDTPELVSTAGTRQGPARRDILAGVLVMLCWVVPIAEGALNAAPNAAWPLFIRDTGTISCLFRSRPEGRSFFYLQTRRDREEWRFWDEHEYFPMEPFGHRTRFDRFMERWGSRNLPARDDLVRWLIARDRELHPDLSPILSVRFLVATQAIRADQPPRGHWQKPDPTRLLRPPKLDSIHTTGQAGRRP